MTIQDDFKAEIETFLERHDMKPAVFGQQALRDPKFVFDLREGRSPSVKTIEKVRAWMATQETAAGAAPAETSTPEPEPASPPPQTDEPAPKAQSGSGWRKPMVAVLVVLIILFGVVALWKPGAFYNLAANLYHRVADSSGGSRGGDTDPAIEQFSAVVSAVQNDFNGLRQDINRLDQRIQRLEEARDESSGGGAAMDSGRIDMLEDRIATLENQPAPVADAPSTPSPALTNRLDNLESRLAEAETQPAVAPQELADLRAQVDGVQESIGRLQARQQDLTALGDQVNSLEDQLNQVTSGMSDMTGLQSGIEQSAVISAFMRLDADVRSGQPYAASLSLYQKQIELQDGSGDWPSAQDLSAEAENGITTNDSLRDRLQSLIPQIIAGQEDGDSWSERLWSRLRGIVVVRKTGDRQGDEPDAIVARAETRLAAGDLKGAVDEMETLPEGRRAIAADWLRDARTRLDALDALSGMATALSTAQGS